MNSSYYVIDASDHRYGPAGIADLVAWAVEGRIAASTRLEEVETGKICVASEIAGIFAEALSARPPSASAPSKASVLSPLEPPQYQHSGPVEVPQSNGSHVEDTENTSGRRTSVPRDVLLMGFNWGAFGMNWIWLFANRAIGLGIIAILVSYIPIAGLIFAISLGIRGNQVAWKHRRFESVSQFKSVQSIWARWGVISVILSILITVGAGIAQINMYQSTSRFTSASSSSLGYGSSSYTTPVPDVFLNQTINVLGSSQTAGGVNGYWVYPLNITHAGTLTVTINAPYTNIAAIISPTDIPAFEAGQSVNDYLLFNNENGTKSFFVSPGTYYFAFRNEATIENDASVRISM